MLAAVRSNAAPVSAMAPKRCILFRAASIAPPHSRRYKLPNDPAFVEKVRDITGLHLNPPDHVIVLCVHEKSKTQALAVDTGQVISRVRNQHRHRQVLDFLRQIDRRTPPELDLHWVVGNAPPTSMPRPKRGWRAIRRHSFTSVRAPKQQIERFTQHHNADTTPFKGVASTESIQQKLKRITKRIDATGH